MLLSREPMVERLLLGAMRSFWLWMVLGEPLLLRERPLPKPPLPRPPLSRGRPLSTPPLPRERPLPNPPLPRPLLPPRLWSKLPPPWPLP